MRKIPAISILVAMIMGLAAWAGTSIVSNREEIIRLKVKGMTMHEDIKEIKSDVKLLLQR